jgi:hypothetical protein
MKIRDFLEHHGVAENPFADEDAQTDLVFKGYCIHSVYHPAWDKIYGNPVEPSTAIVFGEKGSGKTAIRLQIDRHLAEYNADHPDGRVFVVQYDDFNPFLDRFRDTLSGRRRRVERALEQWKLWDHMDAILALGATQLVDRVLDARNASHPAALDKQPLPIQQLDTSQKRDVLLLAACYDQSTAESRDRRWRRLRRKLRFHTWTAWWDLALAILVTAAVVALIIWQGNWHWLATPWPYLAALAGWVPKLGRIARWTWRAWTIQRNTRTLQHSAALLRRMLTRFPGSQLVGQPLPAQPRTDDRYELMAKFQNVLRTLGFTGIIVLVDRLDEPYVVNGSVERMRAILWPMLDNKFLKHPGIGIKLLLPSELIYYIDREDRQFHQRARLDKQNLIRSLEWTGQSLYDLANARLKACAVAGRAPTLAELLAESIDHSRLVNAMHSLRVPRHLFKFLYRLLVTHTNAHSEENPVWRISGETFETVLALYLRDQDAYERGATAG